MAFMCLATWLYLNACGKGEECIPQTWDMFHEKWGFLVIFWNFAGVPFVRMLHLLSYFCPDHAPFSRTSIQSSTWPATTLPTTASRP